MAENFEHYKKWFLKYTSQFYGGDEYINANIKLKEQHSMRVCDEMKLLINSIELSQCNRFTAMLIALMHDLGRFPQFIKYKTYNDPRSVNHCLLALDVLSQTGILDTFGHSQKQLIEKAIKFHGMRELPPNLNGDCLVLSKLIRDADKLDIYLVVTDYYKQYARDPDNFNIEIELPDVPHYTPGVFDTVINGRLVDYSALKTWNDMKLMQIGWVYNIYFTAALKRLRLTKHLETIFSFLPKNDDIKKLKATIFEYIQKRIEKNQ